MLHRLRPLALSTRTGKCGDDGLMEDDGMEVSNISISAFQLQLDGEDAARHA
jgi:hypothetical protein